MNIVIFVTALRSRVESGGRRVRHLSIIESKQTKQLRHISLFRPDDDLLVQTDSGGSLSARWKPLWQGQTLAPRALLWLLAGQGAQEPSPSLDLKVPGKQAGTKTEEKQ